MPTFRIFLDTAFRATASDGELATALSTISAAGGRDISMFTHTESARPRAEFSVDADDRPQAIFDVGTLLTALLEASPAVAGGWVLAAVTPA